MATAEKKVQFYRYYALRGGMRRTIHGVDWAKVLRTWADRAFKDQSVGDVYYLPDLTLRMPALGMHKEVDSSFQTLLDERTATVEAILDHEDPEGEGKVRANSTVVVFIPGTSIVALATGTVQSPRHAALEPFLQDACPLDEGEHWKVEPVLDEARLRAFRDDVDGVRKAELKITSQKDIFNVDDDQGVSAAIDAMATSIGAELDISLTITLKDEFRHRRSSRKSLKEYLQSSLPRLAGAKTARVYPVAPDATESAAISLVADKFTRTVKIDTEKLASRTFTKLATATADVAHACEDELRALEA